VDSAFYVAVLNEDDDLHERAMALGGELIRSRDVRLITSEAVFAEVFAYSSNRGPRQRVYAARHDKTYSLVDCMSMVICRDRGIRDVLTHDHDFTQEGFTTLL